MIGDLSSGLKPIVGILGHHASHNIGQGAGDIGPGLRNRWWLLGLMPHQPLGQRSLVEGRPSRQQEIHRAAQAVNIGTCIDLVTVERLFGSQVVSCPQHLLVVPQRDRILVIFLKEPRQAQVENLDHALGVDQQVARLDVSMYQPGLVSVRQASSRLPDDIGDCPESVRPVVDNQVLQIVALDILHHQEMDLRRTVHLAIDVVGTHDVRMIQRRDRLSLAVKPLEITRIGNLLMRQHLDRTPPTHQHVFGQIHRTHATLAQQRLQAVLAQKKALVLALEQLVGLPWGQRARCDQRIGDRLRIAAGGHPGHQSVQLVAINQPTLPDQVEKRLDGELQRHPAYLPVSCQSPTPYPRNGPPGLVADAQLRI